MKNNLFNRAAGVLAGMAMLCTLVPGQPVRTVGQEVPEGMELIASNDVLELYLDRELAGFAIKGKATGEIWYTNPPDFDEDPLASNYYKGMMKSQVSIRYYNALR